MYVFHSISPSSKKELPDEYVGDEGVYVGEDGMYVGEEGVYTGEDDENASSFESISQL